jgi:hypothetical protein
MIKNRWIEAMQKAQEHAFNTIDGHYKNWETAHSPENAAALTAADRRQAWHVAYVKSINAIVAETERIHGELSKRYLTYSKFIQICSNTLKENEARDIERDKDYTRVGLTTPIKTPHFGAMSESTLDAHMDEWFRAGVDNNCFDNMAIGPIATVYVIRHKIQHIKAIRTQSKLGLYESKLIVDSMNHCMEHNQDLVKEAVKIYVESKVSSI